jgi:hypothetical protein
MQDKKQPDQKANEKPNQKKSQAGKSGGEKNPLSSSRGGSTPVTDENVPDDVGVISSKDFGRSLISMRDAMGFFYKQINPNERPMSAIIMKKNNALLETWKDEVLARMCDKNSKLEAELACISLVVFLNGQDVLRLQKHFEFSDYEKPSRWLQIFEESSIEELWEYQTVCLEIGIKEVSTNIKMAIAAEQYHRVFSQSNDPYEWYTISRRHRELFNGTYYPFGLSKERIMAAFEKVNTILHNKINPTNL